MTVRELKKWLSDNADDLVEVKVIRGPVTLRELEPALEHTLDGEVIVVL